MIMLPAVIPAITHAAASQTKTQTAFNFFKMVGMAAGVGYLYGRGFSAKACDFPLETTKNSLKNAGLMAVITCLSIAFRSGKAVPFMLTAMSTVLIRNHRQAQDISKFENDRTIDMAMHRP